jgi:phage gp29-like protein
MTNVPRPLLAELAPIAEALDVLAYGNILSHTDETLATRGGGDGLKIYARLKRDPHLLSVLNKRKRAVTAREWRIEPASERLRDRQAAEMVRRWVARLNIDKASRGLLDAILMGLAVGEVMWSAEGGEYGPVQIRPRTPWRFAFDSDSRLRLLTKEQPSDGVELPARKFIVHRHADDETDDPYGRGLGSTLFWPVFFKNKDLQFWLEGLDRQAGPAAMGKYPQGAQPADIDKVEVALKSLRRHGIIAVPKDWEVAFIQAQISGAADAFERLARYMDEEISKTVLGETLSTSAGKSGSYALGQVHEGGRQELAKADADDLSETLNATLVRWIVEINMPAAEPPKLWRVFDEPEDLDKIADRDTKLAGLGIHRTDESLQDVYGPGYQRQPAAAPVAQADFAAADDGVQPGGIARLLADMAQDLAPDMDRLIESSSNEANQLDARDFSAGLARVGDALLNVAGSTPQSSLAAKARRWLALAHLTGRADVSDGR